MRAVDLFAEGLNNSEIGRQLKVANQTVSRWRKEFQTRGVTALAKAGRAGRKPSLSASQKDQLTAILRRGPEVYGYETPLWTCARVAHAVNREFDIDYHPGHVWKVLRQLRWSPQMPVGRAIERNEGAIEDWKKNRWPAIKKKPSKKAARSSSSTKAD